MVPERQTALLGADRHTRPGLQTPTVQIAERIQDSRNPVEPVRLLQGPLDFFLLRQSSDFHRTPPDTRLIFAGQRHHMQLRAG